MTVEWRDAGNSSVIDWPDFYGDAVETYHSCRDAVTSGQGTAPGRTVGGAIVSRVRPQSKLKCYPFSDTVSCEVRGKTNFHK